MSLWDMVLFALVVVLAAFIAYSFYKRLMANPFTSHATTDINDLSDQELLLVLDKLTIKLHSLRLSQLDSALEKHGSKFIPLYWCNLVRLYAFSCENQVFLSFLNALSIQHWAAIKDSFNVLELSTPAIIASELSTMKSIDIEQSEHFRYSIRNINDQLQQIFCEYIRHNINYFL